MITVYITCKNTAEAEKVARHLLEQHLIACANMFPVKSMCWWQGKLTKSAEVAIIAKSVQERFERIRQAVKDVHSYEVPCIESYDVTGDDDFAAWVASETAER